MKFKKSIAAFSALAMLGSCTPMIPTVFAENNSTELKTTDNSSIYENNCYVVNSHFYDSDGEIFAYKANSTVGTISYSDKVIGNDSVTFKLNNTDKNDATNLAAYVAQYNTDGTLAKLDKKGLSSTDVNVSIPYTKITDSVSAYIWDGMKNIPEGSADGTISAVASIENDTAESGIVTASLYAIVGDMQTKIKTGETKELASLESYDATLTVNESEIPSNTEKLIIKLDTGDSNTYDAATLYCNVESPQIAPEDSNATTNGAHDPSIVKFPDDENFYVYSSHHLIFTSKDLINWKKYDFTNINASTISPKTAAFISSNYSNTTMNGTYWAPDVIYVPEKDASHPYWMYISLSCGLGGRNSAISLVKSNNPLFWADSSSDVIDCGVVFATKEENGYVTNAIDANIYTDTDTDGTKYFIWGSFWGGIQAKKLTDAGLVDGVNYTSDSTILSSCKAISNTVFSQKNGVEGPEGAWMLNHGNYRYMFTSYGWLGSNYNTRLARSSTSTSFATNTTTQLTDANNVIVGSQYSAGSTSSSTGYKLIGSYRLGNGSYTLSGNDNDGYSIPRSAGDAHIYYGPGHNSAINVGDESFYCSHIRKDATEIAATLEIRKMLYTADGWPVVSPVTYAGEIEQALPMELIAGTYDLASVGHTKMNGSTVKARNFDLPVVSSKITLNADGTMADSLGTWTFNNDHTVTLKFTKSGDTSVDEFYKSGDTMTLYALLGYDKDERKPVIALTGTDQNHITQFAKKFIENTFKTPAKTITETEPITVTKSIGGNPELGFDSDGNILYGGDPAATVIDTNNDGVGDTVYLIVGHDTSTTEAYNMPNWALYTSKDMTNWDYKGSVMSAKDISWRSNDTSAWASQMVPYNGKYYLYYCTWDKTDSGKQSIGVAVADKPEGPYVDKGTPLVKGSFTSPESNSWNDIDPTVLIDTDDQGTEHRYLAWGNGKYYICELNEDMISVKDIDNDGEIVMHKDVKERTIKSMNGGVYTEAPWLYKRDGKYYLFYAMNWREEMAYAIADSPMGRYDYKQTLMPPTSTSNTNHPSVIDFNGETYFIYHNGMLKNGSGFRRSVCIDKLTFDENGYVYPLTETSIGLGGTASTLKSSSGSFIAHDEFVNTLSDADYPILKNMTAKTSENGYNTAWEIKEAKYVPDGANAENYVSLQSVNKAGLYISSDGNTVVLTADSNGNFGPSMSFKTVKGIDGKANTVSFESVSDEGKYLTVNGSETTLSYATNPADCSFVISNATQKDTTAIKVADIEPDPDPEEDITQDFNDTTVGRLISLNTTDTAPYVDLNGVTLYIGTRGNGADSATNFSIASGGVSGNALVLNAGSYQSASRGPRMALYTPAIPDGYTVTASIKVKQGAVGSVLRYNDSTSTETGTDISGLSTTWSTLKISIKNDSETYTRTISLNDNVIATDYTSTFPVLWGTVENKTGQSIYFDDLIINTVDKDGNKPVVTTTLPDPTSKYDFNGNLTNSVTGTDGTLTGSKPNEAASVTTATYVDGENGDKAISFSGAGSYGVNLGNIITSSNYTVSFNVKANAITQFTSGLFIDVDGGTKWISAPIGYQADGTLMTWSHDASNYIDLISSTKINTGEWHRLTLVVTGGSAEMYLDGVSIATGAISDTITDSTNTILAVNYWDTPFNGAFDDLYVFNGTALKKAQVKLIGTQQ